MDRNLERGPRGDVVHASESVVERRCVLNSHLVPSFIIVFVATFHWRWPALGRTPDSPDVTIFLLIASSINEEPGGKRGQRRRRSATASVALASERRLHGRRSPRQSKEVSQNGVAEDAARPPSTAGRGAPPSTAPLPSSSDGTPWTLGRACRRSTHPDASVAGIAMSIWTSG